MAVTRLLRAEDAAALGEILRDNRGFLAPWQPRRTERFYTDDGQHDCIRKALDEHAAGGSVPLVILDEYARVIGTVTLQSIIRGAFQSCSVGYWLAQDAQGRGLATRAVRDAVHIAFEDLRLHRVQAVTLPQNQPSQRVLERVGFTQYGVAPAYLSIAGRWQDNDLYQLLTSNPDRVQTD